MTTDQLLLRPVREADLEALIRLKTDPLVNGYLPYASVPTLEDVEAGLHAELGLAATSEDTLLWGIQRLDDPTLVGQVAVWPREGDVPRAELIILVVPSQWRRGVAYAACTAAISHWLTRFGDSTIYGAVHPENRRCHGLLRKLGLDQECRGDEFPGIHAATQRVFWRSPQVRDPAGGGGRS